MASPELENLYDQATGSESFVLNSSSEENSSIKSPITVESGPVDENLADAIGGSVSIEGIIESLEKSTIEGIRDFSSDVHSKKDVIANLVDLEAFITGITEDNIKDEESRKDISKIISTYLDRVPTSYNLQERIRTFLPDINPIMKDFAF